MAIESGGGGKERDPHKDVVLSVSPVHGGGILNMPVGEALASTFLGTQYQVVRGDLTDPLLPAVAEYFPKWMGGIGEPKVKQDTVEVYNVRGKDPKAAVEQTEPDRMGRGSFRQDKNK